ncbi:ribosomal protein S20 [Compostimonas suwonensis]|uniref:Small ribosomal subunit protein bS20 n=1 Tax=Compostimonas suwonensis TaxID=1048394 RepID=A0A2M9BZ59_9MICO|nr:ribosomal protein S20 [Compostimonas suwonensis]
MLPVGFRVSLSPSRDFAAKRPLPLSGTIKPNFDERRNNVANIKSQIKRIGTNKKAQERNKAVKSEVKTAIRATREAIVAGDKDKATAALLTASKKLDKAASKGVIHKNQAANRKSAIAKAVNGL